MDTMVVILQVVDPTAPMGVPEAASLESKTNHALHKTTWASRCPLNNNNNNNLF